MSEAKPNLRRPASLERTKGRMRVLGVGFSVAFAGLGLRLVEIVLSEAPGQPIAALASTTSSNPTTRADIRDRNGDLLASAVKVSSVHADPNLIGDHQAAAEGLASVLEGVDAERLAANFAKGQRFVWVKRHIAPHEQRALLDLGIPGVTITFEEGRIYPDQALMSHVLGYVDHDNNGLAGVEQALNSELSGRVSGSRVNNGVLELSLDSDVQHAVRDEINHAMTRFRAAGACGLVRDIRTGELLALSSLPDFDPNHPAANPKTNLKNRCTGEVFELGSLFKVLTAAMSIDSGWVTLSKSFDASEPLQIGRYRVRDYHAKERVLSVPEIIAHSSNIGIAKMAFEAGGKLLQQDYLKRFGLMDRLEIELLERRTPLLPPRWPDITTATIAYGHGIAVTPAHFLEAASAVIGDGTRIPTTIIKRDPVSLLKRERVVSETTAKDVEWLLWLTVAKGTGSGAASDAYFVGGKTGTADKIRVDRKGYRERDVISSFFGVFPIENPRYAVLVVLDEPRGDAETMGFHTGGWTAAPTASNIIDRIGPILGIAPSEPKAGQEFWSRLEIKPAWDGYHNRMEDGFAAIRPSG